MQPEPWGRYTEVSEPLGAGAPWQGRCRAAGTGTVPLPGANPAGAAAPSRESPGYPHMR